MKLSEQWGFENRPRALFKIGFPDVKNRPEHRSSSAARTHLALLHSNKLIMRVIVGNKIATKQIWSEWMSSGNGCCLERNRWNMARWIKYPRLRSRSHSGSKNIFSLNVFSVIHFYLEWRSISPFPLPSFVFRPLYFLHSSVIASTLSMSSIWWAIFEKLFFDSLFFV